MCIRDRPYASLVDPASIPPWPSFPDPLDGKPFIQRQQVRTWGLEGWTWTQWQPMVARYLGEVALIDHQVGRILQALDIQPHEHALEVGTGSGFFAACLGQLARSVRTIDLFPDFVAAAQATYVRTGIHNVGAATADEMQFTERDAYDVIAMTGSLPVYDARFERALRVGGRLFACVGDGPMLEAVRVTRTGPSDWSRESLFETGMPALLHAPEPPRFIF